MLINVIQQRTIAALCAKAIPDTLVTQRNAADATRERMVESTKITLETIAE